MFGPRRPDSNSFAIRSSESIFLIKALAKVSDRLAKALMVATAFVTFGIAFAVLVEIVCRLLGIKYFGTAEHIRNLIIVIVFLQLPYAISSRSMLAVDLLKNSLSERFQLNLARVTAILGVIFFVSLAIGAFDPALQAWLNNEYEGEGIVDVPAWPAKFSIVLGSLFSAWLYFLRLIDSSRLSKVKSHDFGEDV